MSAPAPQPLLVHDGFVAAAARFPERVAASLGDDVRTYRTVAAEARAVARHLVALGVGPGDRIGWWGGLSLDAVALYFGIGMAGAAYVPADPNATAGEAAALWETARTAFVVHDAQNAGDVTAAELLATPAPEVALPEVSELWTHVVYGTSGTTGRPKAVAISHRADFLRALTDMTPVATGPTVVMFPQFHMAGWAFSMSAWLAGEEVAFAPGGDTEALLATIESRRADRIYALPAVWRRILDSDPSRFDLRSLTVADTGTSATPLALLEEIHAAFPATTTAVNYGSSECGSLCRLSWVDVPRKPGSVGPPAANVQTRLVNGELQVRSPMLFSGYLFDDAATAAAFDDGWYRTGDLAEVDDEGYVWIVGRARDIIRTGGESVAPAEVDTVLQSHPALADAAVAGVADVDWGEIITAFVVPRAGTGVTLDELRAHCTGRLAPHKHPRRLVVVDAIPRTGATRQVQRRLLLDLVDTP
jgi:acyl-CoA synthetase (AMP-forming)/AMP-acid ligase II